MSRRGDQQLKVLAACDEALRKLKASKLPIVVVEGGIVQEVLNVRGGYDVWDWDDFKDQPSDYWEEMPDDFRANIRASFSAEAIRQIEEVLAEDIEMAYELENKRKAADPFWMVPAEKEAL